MFDINDTDKRADTLLALDNEGRLGHGGYFQCIARAADALVKAGMGSAVYATQWSSGASLWEYPEDSRRVVVDSSGAVGGAS